MRKQVCPNCELAHDVAVYVTGQRVLCRCGIRFEVRRNDVSVMRLQADGAGQGDRAGARAPAQEGPAAPRAEAVARDFVGATVLSPSQLASAGPEAPGEAHTWVRPSSGVAEGTVPLDESGAPLALPGLELLEILGRGGMGEVWRARQRSLGRIVAVKLLPPKLAKDPEFVARFEKEATALAALSHPHIIQIIDRGASDQHYFFVMEFVEGKSLRDLMGPKGMPAREAVRLVLQILRAVECAHDSGIIHRDLKPENILLDGRSHVKVADFGLAGIRRADSQPQLTATSVAMGTLNYMAPEQRRDAKNVDGRADLFSLGVLFYELLTGELPIGRFRLPSERVQGLDPRLDPILSRLLENEPEHRYATASEVIAALEPLVTTSLPGAANSSSVPLSAAAVARSLASGWKGVRSGLAVVGGLALLAFLVRSVLGPVGVQGEGRKGLLAARRGPPRFPPNTNGELFAAVSVSPPGQTPSRFEVNFESGREEFNAYAGTWQLKDGQLQVVQAGSDSGGGRLIPRSYAAHRYFSSDDFTAEVRMDVKPLDAQFTLEEDAQQFGELAFRIKNLQVSAFAIPGAGMRLSWRYTHRDGEEILGNSAQDLEDLVEDEMPLPKVGPFLVRLQLKKRKGGVEVEAFLNNQRFARKLLPNLEGRVGKIALGCRNLSCTFDDLKVRGLAAARPARPPVAGTSD